MNTASSTASRWAVSTRTRGEVQSASVSAAALELVLLGIPESFTVAEAEGWMHDLAGVATETSREDPRDRAIPALLHHALTGLLFSQAELWSQPGGQAPCSIAFVDAGDRAAFGWVGEARVHVIVDGDAFEPQWVIVRDQDGREARAALLPGDRAAVLAIEFWPGGEDGSEAPVAVEAEWLATDLERAAMNPAPPAPADEAAPAAHAEPPAETAAAVGAPPSAISAALPLQQPGLAPPPSAEHIGEISAAQSALETPAVPAADDGIVVMLGNDAPAEPAAQVNEAPAEPAVPSAVVSDAPVEPAAVVSDAPVEPAVPTAPASDAIVEPAVPTAPASDAPVEPAAPVAMESGVMLTDDVPLQAPMGAEDVAAVEALSPPRAPHPVGRWLGRLLGFARRKPQESAPPSDEPPVSQYDALLSERVPAEPAFAPTEQTALELPQVPPPRLVEPDAPMFGMTEIGPAPKSAPRERAEKPAAAEVPAPATEPKPVAAEPAAPAPGPAPVAAEPVATTPDPAPVIAESVAPAPEPAPLAAEPVASAPAPVAAEPVTSAPAPVAAEPVASAPAPLTAEPVASAPAPLAAEPDALAPAPEPVPVTLEHVTQNPDAAAPDALPVAQAPEPSPPPAAEAPPVAPPAVQPPAAIPPAPVRASGSRIVVVSAMHGVDAGALPVLPSPAVPEGPESRAPIRIDREPVGADTTFAIPRVPERPTAPTGPPVFRLPTAQELLANAPLAAPTLEPAAPPVLRVHPPGDAPTAPPMLQLGGDSGVAEAPPVLRVSPLTEPPPAIFPTPPVAPVADAVAAAVPEPAAGGEPDASAAPPTPRRPWPVLVTPGPRRLSKRAWGWVGVVVAVFAAGWLFGVFTNPTEKGEPGPFTRMLRAVGLGSPHYLATVNSTPNGAWIAVDGKDVTKRTPADIELAPGAHTITLSLPDLGGTQVPVKGRSGEHVVVDRLLNGGLDVYSSDASIPISVTLDGTRIGYAPVHLESVAPGLHELQFTGPGMPAWAQTVQVGVRRTAQVVAHPMSAPANGMVQVQATLNDERGAAPLSGAQVWVDGQLRGVTPTSLELPRGPHSLKLTWHGETAPVQVIDLPGGNQRFASFNFGLDSPSPQVVLLGGVHPASADAQVVVSATLTTLQVSDVREAWLHVSTPEGLWQRYPMTAMPGARGPVLACVFPPAALQGGGSRWYVSASTLQGDEYFSEMQSASLAGGGGSQAHHRAGGTTTR